MEVRDAKVDNPRVVGGEKLGTEAVDDRVNRRVEGEGEELVELRSEFTGRRSQERE